MPHVTVGLLVLSTRLLTLVRLPGAPLVPSDLASYNIRALFCSGCWISDPLNYYLGRRGTIFVAALILIATPIASGFTHTWQTLFVIRLILGIGMGAKGGHIKVFLQENPK